MKFNIKSFVTGLLAGALVFGATVTAGAANNGWDLTVYPIKVVVEGQIFQPKDAKGRDALVFTYNGTTYAPLRALAEAYGLEVGYDGATNLATVNKASGDFTSQWTVTEKPVDRAGNERFFTAKFSGNLGMEEFQAWWKSFDEAYKENYFKQIARDAHGNTLGKATVYINYGQYPIGTAVAFDNEVYVNFNLANVWFG